MPGQKIVSVPGVGNVAFPDTMSDEDIGKAIQAQQPPPEPSGWQKFGNWMANASGATNAIQNIKALPAEVQNIPATVQQNVQAGLNQTPAEAKLRWEQMGSPVAAQPVSALAGAASVAPALSAAQEAIPSAARAGKALSEVKSAIGDIPVATGNISSVVDDAKSFAGRGAEIPKVMSDFAKRMALKTEGETVTQAPSNLTFAEARDFYSNARQLTMNELQTLKPQMQRYMVQFANNLGDAVQTAANSAGEGEKFAQAMQEYRQAKTLGEVLDVAKKWGIKGAIGLLGAAGAGAAGAAGYSMYRDLSK